MSALQSDKIESAAPGWRVLVFDEVGSTNDVARDLGLQGEDGFIAVVTESQTQGRGQRSNRWVTPVGRDIMLSVLLRPSADLNLWPRLTTLAALAVCRSIEASVPVQTGIKWPNDVYIGGKKVSGLLAETTFGKGGAFVVLGIGINVNSVEFPDSLKDTATSLKLATGSSAAQLPREPIVAAVLNELRQFCLSLTESFDEALMEARKRSILLGKNVRAQVDGRIVHGRAFDLNQEGHLLLEMADGSVQALASAAEVRPI